MPGISIALVDDHRVVSRSLKAYLESFEDLTVVGVAASGEELLEHLDAWKPDVVVQDLLMPGGLNGIETTRRILLALGLSNREIAAAPLEAGRREPGTGHGAGIEAGAGVVGCARIAIVSFAVSARA
jgi:CheY-like chemotaxis protein